MGKSIVFLEVGFRLWLHCGKYFWGRQKKDLILETTGNGAVIFDFDGDGANDIFIANGATLRCGKLPSQLYRNDGHGHFATSPQRAGLTATGWAQGACTGDIDNDGHPDLFVTYFGHNILYRNLGNGHFADITARGASSCHRHALGYRLRAVRLRS